MTHRGARLSPDRIRPWIARAESQEADRPVHRDVAFSRGVLAVWWMLFLVGGLIQPEADGDAAATLGALDTVILLAALGVLVAVTFLLARARGGDTRGGWAALAGGLFFLGLSLACPATDHHQVAGWWYGQLAASAGMAAVGLVAVRYAITRR